MKRFLKVFLSILFVVALATSIAACGQIDDKDNDNPTPGQTATPDNPTPDAPNNPNTPTEHVHAYGEWEIVTNATCLTNGTRKRTCSCGESETETISALGHDVQNGVCTHCNAVELTLEYSYNNNSQTYTVTNYSGNGSIAIIPEEYDDDQNGKHPVTSIGNSVFVDCSGLTSVTIGNSVTSIGDYAFRGCSGLTSITIPDSVTSIGSYAFSNCYKLVEVYNKSSLNITVGSSDYGKVGYYAKAVYTKEYTSKLSTDENGYIIYTDGEDKILIGYTGTETELILPEGITEINQCAFYYSTKITKVIIPDSVTSIGDSAFSGCSELTSIIIPDSVTSIGDEAFYGCRGLTSVTIGNSVTSIGSYVFAWCSGLMSVTIGNSVKSIDNDAFYACGKLIEVYNKSSLNIIVGSSDYGRVGYFAKAVYTEEYTSKLSTDENGYIIYTDGEDKILIGYTGTETELTLPEGITEINKDAFYENNKITKVIIPDSVTSIGHYAFSGCSGLTSVTIGNSVTSIGSYAFHYCRDLTSITIGNGVTSIGYEAFSDCSSLTIYCEATTKPSGWNSDWNPGGCKVVWGAK